jgi:sugar phosphate isomerase/epimerase
MLSPGGMGEGLFPQPVDALAEVNPVQKVSRRSFLERTSTLAAGLWARAGVQGARTSGPNLVFPTSPRERLAVASWPFRAFIESPTNRWARNPKLAGMDLKDFAAMVVQEFNLSNIEPLGQHFRSTEPAYLAEFREAVEKAGSHVVNIPTGVGGSFYDPDKTKRQDVVERAKKWVDVAVAVGSPSLRMNLAAYRHTKPDVDLTSESLKQLADYAADKNVLINLENDDLFSEDAFFIVRVVQKVNHPYLHALPDFCNSMLSGNPEFCYAALKAMFPLAYNIAHMKDSETGDGGKVYTVDVARCFEIARTAGYKGYFSMEWEGQGEPYAGTHRLIEESLKNLA